MWAPVLQVGGGVSTLPGGLKLDVWPCVCVLGRASHCQRPVTPDEAWGSHLPEAEGLRIDGSPMCLWPCARLLHVLCVMHPFNSYLMNSFVFHLIYLFTYTAGSY